MTLEQRKIEIFGVHAHALSMSETLDVIDQRLAAGKFTQHVVVNVAKIVNIQDDHDLAESVKACDIVNIDGMGVVWGARLLGHDIPERVAGVDLFLQLVARAAERQYPIYLLGAEQAVVEQVVAKLRRLHPDLPVAGWHHGYFWDDEEALVEKVRESGARLLFVAITSPRKENFINRWKSRLGVDFVMGVGGTFDVVAGKVNRAPLWMQRSGLEWLYRVIQEPRRMWKRYLITNSVFAFLLLRRMFVQSRGW
ncbi:WecB/TagA/CpsF family glycosyltransferase [Cupriavidus sp. CV2]|uniref:WecB/TagA/CpsF family glycosyltransferase n=1 Tax=Cupriavidus ulmosensis TaxID=3065913 RepID=UPI00296B3379|nr:WecB/TagA/CpsF family glycosyltransferase [Cupriavidus sp. CV2]MDW3686384.1 WecB/TagA/CpsF family glycosyltransferase [Cupriavidus sp. CV2]